MLKSNLKTIISLILLFSLFLFLNCDGSGGVSPHKDAMQKYLSDTANQIIPLEVGNYWLYVDSVFNTNDTVIDSSKLKIIATGEIKYNDEIAYETYLWNWNDLKNKSYDERSDLLRKENDGVVSVGAIKAKDTVLAKSYVAKYPVNKDDIWTRNVFIYSEIDKKFLIRTVNVECTDVAALFTTTDTTFSCFEYYEHSELDTYIYYAYGIGMVGIVRKKNGIVKSKKILKSYNLN